MNIVFALKGSKPFILICNQIKPCEKLSELMKSINDRLMTIRLSLSCYKHATIISAYAPTMTNPDELILHNDVNAKGGTDHQTLKGVIGPECHYENTPM